MMRVTDRRQLGKSGVEVPVIGFGGAPARQPVPGVLRRAGPRHRARRLRCRHAPVRHRAALRPRPVGAPDRRGAALARRATATCSRPRSAACCGPSDPEQLDGGLFKQILPFEGVYDYSYDGVMRSVEDSLQRLGTHRIDVLLIHDVDVWTHGSEDARLQRFARGHGGRLPRHAEAARGGRGRAPSAPASTRSRPARISPAPATSTASCSPAATPCWSRRRWTRCCPTAPSGTSRS